MRFLTASFYFYVPAFFIYIIVFIHTIFAFSKENYKRDFDADIYNDADSSSSPMARSLVEPRTNDRPGSPVRSDTQAEPKEDPKTDPVVVAGLQQWMQNERQKQQGVMDRLKEAKEAPLSNDALRGLYDANPSRNPSSEQLQKSPQDRTKADLKTSRKNVMNLALSSKVMHSGMKQFGPPLPNVPIGHPDSSPKYPVARLYMQSRLSKQQGAFKQAQKGRESSIEAIKLLKSGMNKQGPLPNYWDSLKLDREGIIRLINAQNVEFKNLDAAKEIGKNMLTLGMTSKELGDYMQKKARPKPVRVPRSRRELLDLAKKDIQVHDHIDGVMADMAARRARLQAKASKVQVPKTPKVLSNKSPALKGQKSPKSERSRSPASKSSQTSIFKTPRSSISRGTQSPSSDRSPSLSSDRSPSLSSDRSRSPTSERRPLSISPKKSRSPSPIRQPQSPPPRKSQSLASGKRPQSPQRQLQVQLQGRKSNSPRDQSKIQTQRSKTPDQRFLAPKKQSQASRRQPKLSEQQSRTRTRKALSKLGACAGRACLQPKAKQ